MEPGHRRSAVASTIGGIDERYPCGMSTTTYGSAYEVRKSRVSAAFSGDIHKPLRNATHIRHGWQRLWQTCRVSGQRSLTEQERTQHANADVPDRDRERRAALKFSSPVDAARPASRYQSVDAPDGSVQCAPEHDGASRPVCSDIPALVVHAVRAGSLSASGPMRAG